MTTAVRPKSGLDWAIEVPESVDKEDADNSYISTNYINEVLYNVALGARFGWVDMPDSLSLTEQALIAWFRTLKAKEGYLATKVSEVDPREDSELLTELGKMFWWHLRIAQAEPQVGHFIGKGFEGNEEDADRWQHAGH